MNTTIGTTRIELLEGNIANQTTDAVVTAAHWDLAGGQGTDGAIHGKAGPKLLQACRAIGFCPVGEAVLTEGFGLPARFVIHAVGPVWNRDKLYQAAQLASAYEMSLGLCREHGIRSVSFPSISTGAFCYPMRLAAPIAMRAIRDFLVANPRALDVVRFVLYPREAPAALAIYSEALHVALAEGPIT